MIKLLVVILMTLAYTDMVNASKPKSNTYMCYTAVTVVNDTSAVSYTPTWYHDMLVEYDGQWDKEQLLSTYGNFKDEDSLMIMLAYQFCPITWK